jgi:exodeoxyribonuclease VII large subunit
MKPADESLEARDTVLSVSQLTETVRNLLETRIGSVQVSGEISNLRRQPSGHIYFTLKDEGSQVRAVMFRGDARGLAFEPRDGDQVVARGEVTVYVPRGDYQLRVTTLRPQGRGTLQERFEALKRKLQAEGLFDAARKRPLPVFPERVAVITSPSGAALQDFLNVLGRRCPRIAVDIYGVRVQGEGAHREIIAALDAAIEAGNADVVVITRGGGSLEDLWEFNEEALARAISASPVPVISGVGHEIDFTIGDFAADLRAPTPSAAAELLSESDETWRNTLEQLGVGVRRAMDARLDEARWQLNGFREHYVFREPVRIVHQWFQRFDELESVLRRELIQHRQRRVDWWKALQQTWQALDPRRPVVEARQRVDALGRQLHLLSPQATLERGYALAMDERGKLVRSARQARQLDAINVRFADGSVRTHVER